MTYFLSLRLLMICWTFGLLNVGYCNGSAVHEHGYWVGKEVMKEHQFDPWLAHALAQFFKKENAQSVVDMGCGPGDYVRVLRAYQIPCEGYDGNPDTVELSQGLCQVVDLSEPFHLDQSFDWVLSLEVAEHLPKVYETIFIENLHRHSTRGIVLSWAIKGQGGFGHFNEQNNDYVKNLMSKYGYINDLLAENELRKFAALWWFKNTIMVFRKVTP